MGSRSSKPQPDIEKKLDESTTILFKVLNGLKPDGLHAVGNYAGLAAAADSVFTTVKSLLDVDVKALPDDQQKSYEILINEYFAIIRNLSIFLDEQIAVVTLLADECAEPQPDPELLEKWYNRIDVAGCKAFTLQVHEFIQRVVTERVAVTSAIYRRIRNAVLWGLVGALALGLTVGVGILAPTAAIAIAAAGTVGSVLFLPLLNQMRESIIEAKNLKAMEQTFKVVENDLRRVHQSMSDTNIAYAKLHALGFTHKRLGQYANGCLVDMQKARQALLSA
jgi:hypothetical protein